MAIFEPTVSLVLSAVATGIYITCTVTNYWIIIDTPDEYIHYGLWRYCVDTNETSVCDSLNEDQVKGYVSSARMLMIICCITSLATWSIALIAVIRKCTKAMWLELARKFGTTFKVVNGIVFILAVLTALAGIVLYAAGTKNDLEYIGTEYSFGYSLIFGWLGIPLGIMGGVLLILFIRRTKEKDPDILF